MVVSLKLLKYCSLLGNDDIPKNICKKSNKKLPASNFPSQSSSTAFLESHSRLSKTFWLSSLRFSSTTEKSWIYKGKSTPWAVSTFDSCSPLSFLPSSLSWHLCLCWVTLFLMFMSGLWEQSLKSGNSASLCKYHFVQENLHFLSDAYVSYSMTCHDWRCLMKDRLRRDNRISCSDSIHCFPHPRSHSQLIIRTSIKRSYIPRYKTGRKPCYPHTF